MGQKGLEAQKLGRVTGENSSAALKIGDNRPAEIAILAMGASRLFPLGDSKNVVASGNQSLTGSQCWTFISCYPPGTVQARRFAM
jgi:hypothetical protein